ncbi:MAG TPA: caspase family protein [Kofleriaceae bacterium]|nr:caspase family protein [Kofleriaceae bacterium]
MLVGGADVSEYRDIGELSEAAPAGVPMVGRSLIAAIGIDRYAHWPALHNAVNDVRGVVGAFGKLGFEPAGPPLFDGDATRLAIDSLLDDLETKLSPADHLVVFFAGHGWAHTQDIGDTPVTTGYLIPADAAHQGNRTASLIELDSFLRKISKLPPLHILVILDACHAGVALSSLLAWGRGSGPLNTPFEAVHRRMSRMVIASALDDEAARDGGPEPGHSLFTSCLIDALNGGAPGIDLGDGRRVLNGSDLGHYVRERVQTYPGDPGWRQTPDFGGFWLHRRGDMPILLPHGPDATTRIPEPPKRLAAGSVPTMLAATPELLAASEPAFTSSWLAQDALDDDFTDDPCAGLHDRPSSPRLVRPPSIAGVPALRAQPLQASEPPVRAQPSGCLIAASVSVALIVLTALGASCLLRGPSSANIVMFEPADPPPDPMVWPGRAASFESPPVPRPAPPPKLVPAPVGQPAAGNHGHDQAPALDTIRPDHHEAVVAPPPPAAAPAAAPVPPPDATTSASTMRRAAKQQELAARHPGECFALVNVTPGGAEIVRDRAVIEKTHKDLYVPLPCGAEVALTFQKPSYGVVTKTVQAAPGGVQVNSRLRQITCSMTVSSTPRGAAILLGDKQLGVTPATVKIPAGEPVTLVIAKDGYPPISQVVVPADGGSVTVPLKKASRKAP